jgi:LPXTG-motif cell wall-anchored protein
MKAVIPLLLLLLGVSVSESYSATPTVSPYARPAPGPLMGAGLLPVLLVGGGIYWLVRRKKTQSS